MKLIGTLNRVENEWMTRARNLSGFVREVAESSFNSFDAWVNYASNVIPLAVLLVRILVLLVILLLGLR